MHHYSILRKETIPLNIFDWNISCVEREFYLFGVCVSVDRSGYIGMKQQT